MALFGILFLTLCFTFCFVSSEATVSVKEARSEPYTVLVVCRDKEHIENHSEDVIMV